MLFIRFKKLLCWLPVVLVSCLEPYEPPVITDYPDLLVVNGFINNTNGIAEVKLSRTASLTDQTFLPEEKATVSIEDEQGNSIFLSEQNAGTYEISGITLSTAKKYRMLIKTTTNKTYASDYVSIKQTPQIDSINWDVAQDGLNVYVNTHDPTGSSRFYRWEYIETYEYTADYTNSFKVQNGTAVFDPDYSVYRCWKTVPSTQILVGTSNRLTEDRVSNFNLLTVPQRSIKLFIKYSILVRQYALTEEAYNYWLNLQKNTEGLGGLFDPLPSQAIGNIRCLSDPNEFVIGYINAGSVSEKRIFIQAIELPRSYSTYRRQLCELDTILIDEIPTLSDGKQLINAVYPPVGPPVVIGYTSAPSNCTDCIVSGGGVPVKPDFWE